MNGLLVKLSTTKRSGGTPITRINELLVKLSTTNYAQYNELRG
jgi:hypothetical protein